MCYSGDILLTAKKVTHRELNEQIVQRPYPIPKINTTLLKLKLHLYNGIRPEHGLLTYKNGPKSGQDVYHHSPVQQILIIEIANENEWFNRHPP